MILDLVLNKDKTLLFSASVDMLARSWLPEVGGEAKVFEGGERSITLLVLKGQTCESSLLGNELELCCCTSYLSLTLVFVCFLDDGRPSKCNHLYDCSQPFNVHGLGRQ